MSNYPPGTLHSFEAMTIDELREARVHWGGEVKYTDDRMRDLRKISRDLAKTLRLLGDVGYHPRIMERTAMIWLIRRETELAALEGKKEEE